MKKRILSLLLVLCMVFTFIPVTAGAAVCSFGSMDLGAGDSWDLSFTAPQTGFYAFGFHSGDDEGHYLHYTEVAGSQGNQIFTALSDDDLGYGSATTLMWLTADESVTITHGLWNLCGENDEEVSYSFSSIDNIPRATTVPGILADYKPQYQFITEGVFGEVTVSLSNLKVYPIMVDEADWYSFEGRYAGTIELFDSEMAPVAAGSYLHQYEDKPAERMFSHYLTPGLYYVVHTVENSVENEETLNVKKAVFSELTTGKTEQMTMPSYCTYVPQVTGNYYITMTIPMVYSDWTLSELREIVVYDVSDPTVVKLRTWDCLDWSWFEKKENGEWDFEYRDENGNPIINDFSTEEGWFPVDPSLIIPDISEDEYGSANANYTISVDMEAGKTYYIGALGGDYTYFCTIKEKPAEDKKDENKQEEEKPTPKTFSDVAESAWYNEAVKFVTESGLMNGVSDSSFAPENTVTRNMVMTVLARMAGIDTEGGVNWYEKAMNWAKEQGITDGSDAEGTITREQLVTMLYRYMKTPEVKTDLRKYTDADSVSEWAVNAFVWAVENGIITGMTETTLGATGATTRAQLATILMRFSEMAK